MHFPACHIIRTTQNVVFWVWLLSLSKKHLTFIHIVMWTSNLLPIIPFWVIFQYLDVPWFVYPFTSQKTFGLFPVLGIHGQNFTWTKVSSSLRSIPRSGIAGLHGKYMFNFIKNCQIFFPEVWMQALNIVFFKKPF